jgi:hypothetical protein
MCTVVNSSKKYGHVEVNGVKHPRCKDLNASKWYYSCLLYLVDTKGCSYVTYLFTLPNRSDLCKIEFSYKKVFVYCLLRTCVRFWYVYGSL